VNAPDWQPADFSRDGKNPQSHYMGTSTFADFQTVVPGYCAPRESFAKRNAPFEEGKSLSLSVFTLYSFVPPLICRGPNTGEWHPVVIRVVVFASGGIGLNVVKAARA